jgi:formylglycine-generating enzyme required for sulfatase activity
LKANPFGLYDIHGNVWEWVQDGWDATYYGQSPEKPAINPSSPFSAGSQRVVRGGGWRYPASRSRSSSRYANVPTDRFSIIGFRVSLVVDAVKQQLALKTAVTPPPAVAPFDAQQARAHQEAWAKNLGVPVEYTNSIGMKFVLIPPGEFMMGSTPAEIEAALTERGDKHWQDCVRSEAPRHKVILTQPIYIGVNEVTQAEYEKVMGKNPSSYSPTGKDKAAVAGLDTTRHPVEAVNWNDAAEFCAKLSQHEKLKPFYFRAGATITPLDGTGYRLPSEAEWEFACRAGTVSKFWSGEKDQDLAQAGWFQGNSGGRTHAVGELKANPLGLHDIHGNAWEWVQDTWNATWYDQFRESPAINPASPFDSAAAHVVRGGSRSQSASNTRSSLRHARSPSALGAEFGFRVSLPVDAVRRAVSVPPADQKTSDNPPAPAKAPFDAKQARAHQEAWARHLGTTVETTNSVSARR